MSISSPAVSVVMPVRNEIEGLEAAVQSVFQQDYEGDVDLWVAVAPSVDGTEGLLDELAARHPKLHRVENPLGSTPSGLNAAIAASAGEVVVRVDGHARLPQGYIRTAVATLLRTGAVNVGGRQHGVGRTPFENAVAAVTNSWLGSGGASYRTGGAAGAVDTVYLGVFLRSAGDAVGWFDERLLRNQDYELNIRLRGAGGVIWFDPDLAVSYRPRSTYRALGRQYFAYGQYKYCVSRLHPQSLRPRQIAPAAVAPGLMAAGVTCFLIPQAALVPCAYLAVVAAMTVKLRPWTWRLPLVSLTIHLAWSFGFWQNAVRQLFANPTSRTKLGRS